MSGENAVEGAEDFGFEIEAFGGGFDGDVRGGEGFHFDGRADAAERRFDFGFGELAFGGLAAEVCADRVKGALKKALINIAQRDWKPLTGEDVGDAGPHGPGADDSNRESLPSA